MAHASAGDWVEQALLYASLHDWSLIPLVPRREVAAGRTGMPPPEPRFQPWQEEHASDEPTIRAWGDVVERSDIGLVTGNDSSVVVLEVRIEPGGQESLQELCPEAETLPETVRFSDYNRDAWLIYQHPGFPVASTELGPGLFLHGEGGIVRLPESQYLRASGGLSWDAAPGLDSVASLPDWFWQSAGIDVRTPRNNTTPAPAHAGAALPFERAADTTASKGTPPWIAKPWAAAGSLSLVLGTAKRAGKSTWLRHLAQAVLGGEDFLEHNTAESPVLFLTEESRAVFGQALEVMGTKDDPVTEDLHVLYHSDVKESSWKSMVDACLDRSAETGARLVVIDTLNRFTGKHRIEELPVDDLHALERLMEHGLAVIAAVQHPAVRDNPVDGVLQSLGPIVSVSDTVCHLRPLPRGAATHRRIDVWSRFQDADGMYIHLTPQGYRPLRSSTQGPSIFDGREEEADQLNLTKPREG